MRRGLIWSLVGLLICPLTIGTPQPGWAMQGNPGSEPPLLGHLGGMAPPKTLAITALLNPGLYLASLIQETAAARHEYLTQCAAYFDTTASYVTHVAIPMAEADDAAILDLAKIGTPDQEQKKPAPLKPGITLQLGADGEVTAKSTKTDGEKISAALLAAADAAWATCQPFHAAYVEAAEKTTQALAGSWQEFDVAAIHASKDYTDALRLAVHEFGYAVQWALGGSLATDLYELHETPHCQGDLIAAAPWNQYLFTLLQPEAPAQDTAQDRSGILEGLREFQRFLGCLSPEQIMAVDLAVRLGAEHAEQRLTEATLNQAVLHWRSLIVNLMLLVEDAASPLGPGYSYQWLRKNMSAQLLSPAVSRHPSNLLGLYNLSTGEIEMLRFCNDGPMLATSLADLVNPLGPKHKKKDPAAQAWAALQKQNKYQGDDPVVAPNDPLTLYGAPLSVTQAAVCSAELPYWRTGKKTPGCHYPYSALDHVLKPEHKWDGSCSTLHTLKARGVCARRCGDGKWETLMAFSGKGLMEDMSLPIPAKQPAETSCIAPLRTGTLQCLDAARGGGTSVQASFGVAHANVTASCVGGGGTGRIGPIDDEGDDGGDAGGSDSGGDSGSDSSGDDDSGSDDSGDDGKDDDDDGGSSGSGSGSSGSSSASGSGGGRGGNDGKSGGTGTRTGPSEFYDFSEQVIIGHVPQPQAGQASSGASGPPNRGGGGGGGDSGGGAGSGAGGGHGHDPDSSDGAAASGASRGDKGNTGNRGDAAFDKEDPTFWSPTPRKYRDALRVGGDPDALSHLSPEDHAFRLILAEILHLYEELEASEPPAPANDPRWEKLNQLGKVALNSPPFDKALDKAKVRAKKVLTAPTTVDVVGKTIAKWIGKDEKTCATCTKKAGDTIKKLLPLINEYLKISGDAAGHWSYGYYYSTGPRSGRIGLVASTQLYNVLSQRLADTDGPLSDTDLQAAADQLEIEIASTLMHEVLAHALPDALSDDGDSSHRFLALIGNMAAGAQQKYHGEDMHHGGTMEIFGDLRALRQSSGGSGGGRGGKSGAGPQSCDPSAFSCGACNTVAMQAMAMMSCLGEGQPVAQLPSGGDPSPLADDIDESCFSPSGNPTCGPINCGPNEVADTESCSCKKKVGTDSKGIKGPNTNVCYYAQCPDGSDPGPYCMCNGGMTKQQQMQQLQLDAPMQRKGGPMEQRANPGKSGAGAKW